MCATKLMVAKSDFFFEKNAYLNLIRAVINAFTLTVCYEQSAAICAGKRLLQIIAMHGLPLNCLISNCDIKLVICNIVHLHFLSFAQQC